MTYDTQGRRVLQGHPSTWPQEVEQLRAENERLRTIAAKAISEVLMGLARDAAEAEAKALRRDYGLMQTDRNNLRSLLDATEAKVDELHEKLEDAQSEAKALRARVQELEAALTWYRDQHRISGKPTIDAEWAATRLKTDGGARADAAQNTRNALRGQDSENQVIRNTDNNSACSPHGGRPHQR